MSNAGKIGSNRSNSQESNSHTQTVTVNGLMKAHLTQSIVVNGMDWNVKGSELLEILDIVGALNETTPQNGSTEDLCFTGHIGDRTSIEVNGIVNGSMTKSVVFNAEKLNLKPEADQIRRQAGGRREADDMEQDDQDEKKLKVEHSF
ncbi:uncharacterized protein LOC106065076 [Biomphalaria glabrata]|uniref:Uncharacterized protein LOC106065076 n=1 Tax=Biomphalaria glabrata TaxID=6526 RepID=A0A9W3BFK9_BIOGL|nr:uncharacterized protein LOC106065076 [Biomphalaria glabrata]XP_055898214.1 uncharacterized protein LOC106065076 [Biomphalaria glabrata]